MNPGSLPHGSATSSYRYIHNGTGIALSTNMPKANYSIKKLLACADVTHEPEHETEPIEGNFAYDTERETRAAEEFTRELAEDTIWGWCRVRTTAKLGDVEATVYLGCASYEGHDNFVACDGETQSHEAAAELLALLRERRATSVLRTLRA